MDGWSESGIRIYNGMCKQAEKDRTTEHGILFEKIYLRRAQKDKEKKDERVFNEESFVKPYNNLEDDSDEDSSDDEDDDVVDENEDNLSDGYDEDEEVDEDEDNDEEQNHKMEGFEDKIVSNNDNVKMSGVSGLGYTNFTQV